MWFGSRREGGNGTILKVSFVLTSLAVWYKLKLQLSPNHFPSTSVIYNEETVSGSEILEDINSQRRFDLCSLGELMYNDQILIFLNE